MVDYPFVTSYAVGNASVDAAGLTVSGQGTFWQDNANPELSPIRAGDLFGTHKGFAIRIAEVVSATELTLAHPWPGVDQDLADYEIQLTPRIVGAQQATRLLQKQLSSGNISAFAALEGQASLLPMFTGAGTMTLVTKQSLVSGADYDVQVNDLAGRAAYDGSVANFRVLVADIGNGRSAIYSKNTNTLGDWSAPAFVTGPSGIAGPYTEITIGTTTTLPAGSPATVTPTVVDEDTIRLDFGLPKGLDGTGTGDVVGPSSSVANRVAVFGGTSGKTIIDSGVILGNSASRNVGTTAGTVAAGDDARFSAGGQNDAILALEIADLKGARLGMKGGVADAFDDETGVDVKTNATYDDANDWYKPTVSGQANQIPAMTAATTGAVTMSASSIFDANYAAWKAGDRATSTAWVTPGNVTTGWLQVDFGSAVTITSYTILPRASTPTQAPTNWAIKGSNDGSNFTTIATVTNYTNWVDGVSRSFDISSPGSYRYYRLDATSVGSGANSVAIGELTMLNSGVYANMTLVSVAYPLASVPTTARMTLQTVEFDAATPNTDFVAEFSRDGGTTWTAANLMLSPYLVVGNYKMYEAQPFSVTGQPSGSSMKWRARTLTNKNIAMSGIVSQGN